MTPHLCFALILCFLANYPSFYCTTFDQLRIRFSYLKAIVFAVLCFSCTLCLAAVFLFWVLHFAFMSLVSLAFSFWCFSSASLPLFTHSLWENYILLSISFGCTVPRCALICCPADGTLFQYAVWLSLVTLYTIGLLWYSYLRTQHSYLKVSSQYILLHKSKQPSSRVNNYMCVSLVYHSDLQYLISHHSFVVAPTLYRGPFVFAWWSKWSETGRRPVVDRSWQVGDRSW